MELEKNMLLINDRNVLERYFDEYYLEDIFRD